MIISRRKKDPNITFVSTEPIGACYKFAFICLSHNRLTLNRSLSKTNSLLSKCWWIFIFLDRVNKDFWPGKWGEFWLTTKRACCQQTAPSACGWRTRQKWRAFGVHSRLPKPQTCAGFVRTHLCSLSLFLSPSTLGHGDSCFCLNLHDMTVTSHVSCGCNKSWILSKRRVSWGYVLAEGKRS